MICYLIQQTLFTFNEGKKKMILMYHFFFPHDCADSRMKLITPDFKWMCMLIANIWIPLTIISKKIFQRIRVVAFIEMHRSHNNQHQRKLHARTSHSIQCAAAVWHLLLFVVSCDLNQINRFSSFIDENFSPISMVYQLLNTQKYWIFKCQVWTWISAEGLQIYVHPLRYKIHGIAIKYSIQTNSCWSHWWRCIPLTPYTSNIMTSFLLIILERRASSSDAKTQHLEWHVPV